MCHDLDLRSKVKSEGHKEQAEMKIMKNKNDCCLGGVISLHLVFIMSITVEMNLFTNSFIHSFK